MDCKEVEEQLVLYLLGALDSKEASRIDYHVDSCAECNSKLRHQGDLAVDLAYAVPQFEAPVGVKERLFSRIDAASVSDSSPRRAGVWSRILPDLGRRLVANSGLAAASVLVVVTIVGGIWFNSRINEIADEKEKLAAQIETVARGEAEMIETLRDQRRLTHKAITATSLKTLSATDRSTSAEALIAFESTGMTVTISAMDMPQLANDEMYRVWLVKNGRLVDTGAAFTVDATGYGQVDLELNAPLAEFDTMLITIGTEYGGPERKGDSVLKGDL